MVHNVPVIPVLCKDTQCPSKKNSLHQLRKAMQHHPTQTKGCANQLPYSSMMGSISRSWRSLESHSSSSTDILRRLLCTLSLLLLSFWFMVPGIWGCRQSKGAQWEEHRKICIARATVVANGKCLHVFFGHVCSLWEALCTCAQLFGTSRFGLV